MKTRTTTKDILHQKAYEMYQLSWMLTHGYSLTSLLNELNDLVKEAEDANLTPSMAFQEFDDTGFHGELWVCFDEFMNCEYQDTEFMESLFELAPMKEYWLKLYYEDMQEEEKEVGESYYQKDDDDKLNFFECLQLLNTLIEHGILYRDVKNENNVLVYWSGDKLNPEGWYSRNIHDVAGELHLDEESQSFLRWVLKEEGVELKFKVIFGFMPMKTN